jgi:hypothetical protein
VNKRVTNIGFALLGGAIVFVAGMMVGMALLPHDRISVVHQLIVNCVTSLTTVVIALSIQLRHEERHYQTATERAINMAELNHNVRNSIFPLFLAVQRSGEPESDRLAQEAMARLDIALRDATVDAYSGRIRYAQESVGKAAAA